MALDVLTTWAERADSAGAAGHGRGESSIRGIPRKPLDNPQRPKPTYSSDDECARLLQTVLQQVPWHLAGDSSSRFPLLDALNTVDVSRGTDAARNLIFIAAVNHRTADERRTAEYLLRNRHEVVAGLRSAKSLLMAARCAAELDVRRVRFREATVPPSLAAPSTADRTRWADRRSAGELTLDALRAAVGPDAVNAPVEAQVFDAVNIALEVAERHALNGGKGSAVLAMRTDARPPSRLVTHLRREFADDAAAPVLARLLVGADATPIETALLWWSARHEGTSGGVPPEIRARWLRYLGSIGNRTGIRPQARAHALDAGATYPLQSGIPDAGCSASEDPPTRRFRIEPVVRKAERMTDHIGVRCMRGVSTAIDVAPCFAAGRAPR